MTNERTIPAASNPDLVTFTILTDGQVVPRKAQILSIAVSKEVNRVPVATIVFLDGDPASGNFFISNDDFFVPGKEIEIKAGYHSDEQTLFKGIITGQRIRIRENESRLMVSCKDAVFKMTLGRHSRYFSDISDSDVFETLLNEYGLPNEVEATGAVHQQVVQYEATDWDFLLSRADANGLLCMVDDGRMTIQKPDFDQEPVVTTLYGATILELDAEMDGRSQYEGVKAENWDMANQEVLEVEAAEPSYQGPGNLSGTQISNDLGLPVWELQHGGNMKEEELQAWADAKLRRNRLAKIRGRVSFQGFAGVKPGTMITLSGIGDRFNGDAFVSGVHHQIVSGNWTTTVQFGLDEKWFAHQYTISHPPAAHLLPAVSGLQIGVVTALEGDPEGEDRIKVRLPLVSPQEEGAWARLACIDAGDSRGMFFRPEIDDEVVVGFINGHPADAVILGSLHSSAKPTPEPLADDNFRKGFISKTDLKVIFDDEKKSITLQTPGGNTFQLDDDAGAITFEDQNGNKITMDSAGIKIESNGKIEIKATQDFNAEGLNVGLKAQAQFAAEGSASAELSASGSTTIKGSIVQIN
ncbi:MAG TPA: type VI secretion system tip protein VgrG [Bacteroidetes bacterium]|nr:type VI secretion system tip protein VgrG [Bacteroidota bacterium]